MLILGGVTHPVSPDFSDLPRRRAVHLGLSSPAFQDSHQDYMFRLGGLKGAAPQVTPNQWWPNSSCGTRNSVVTRCAISHWAVTQWDDNVKLDTATSPSREASLIGGTPPRNLPNRYPKIMRLGKCMKMRQTWRSFGYLFVKFQGTKWEYVSGGSGTPFFGGT